MTTEEKTRLPTSSGELPVSVACPAVELTVYAEGSVVSRTLARTPGGTMTAFAFDAGQGLSEHSAPFDAYVHVIDGAARLVIGGATVQAKVGDVVRMPANVPHAVYADERFKMLLVMLR